MIDILIDKFKPAIDDATKPRTIRIDYDISDPPSTKMAGVGGAFHFATGTLGKLGNWFGDFPQTGAAAMLHGMEAVITPQQAPAFAMDVLGANAGFNTDSPARQTTTQPTRVHATIENRIFLGGREITDFFTESQVTAIENNARGLRSRYRDALGVD